ncbi:hypothetical protein GCK72_010868 [Caenorhabditis remanei]|uniref:Tr-type G domain-containing protein n=1 Tax=Caenorhabditis remanei TaxID=31234 RepID=A0A6A5H6W5_CAERE|nr:hypothetical protein GCK72_010868 [Caenorhabditis remanei]KAF1762606.1 hypothetical protein GCK72_010868 [Caenorhabditis remanei]
MDRPTVIPDDPSSEKEKEQEEEPQILETMFPLVTEASENSEEVMKTSMDSEDENKEGESESESESESEDEEEQENRRQCETKEEKMERVKERIEKRKEAAAAKRSINNLRSPVISVVGYFGSGKMDLLKNIRRTNLHEGESTEVSGEAIQERCQEVNGFLMEQMQIPGLLVIDTAGHESFSNLRTCGSSLSDMAILIVDIMVGLDSRTMDLLKLLYKGKTPFVIALNRIDGLSGYESNSRKDVYELLQCQKTSVYSEFKARVEKIVGEFADQKINVALSNSKHATDPDYVIMIPTSAKKGDGIGNLLSCIVNETQTKYAQKLAYSEEIDATITDLKEIPGEFWDEND